jgi:hypothetical protein
MTVTAVRGKVRIGERRLHDVRDAVSAVLGFVGRSMAQRRAPFRTGLAD